MGEIKISTPTGNNSSGKSGGLGVTYWLEDVATINSQIATCNLCASNLISKLKTMHECLRMFVNVSGSWCDANSKVFAEWWNEGTYFKLTQVDGKGLAIDKTIAPGSLRIIMNKCAKLYWLVICNQLYVVTKGKFPAKKQLFSPSVKEMYELGKDKRYIEASVKNDDDVWTTLMSKITGKPVLDWKKNLQITTGTNESSTTSTQQLSLFTEAFTKAIDEFSLNLQAYINSIETILKDDVNKKYFGLNPNENMKKAAHDLTLYSDFAMKAIGNDIKKILKIYPEAVNTTIDKYLNRNYIIQ